MNGNFLENEWKLPKEWMETSHCPHRQHNKNMDNCEILGAVLREKTFGQCAVFLILCVDMPSNIVYKSPEGKCSRLSSWDILELPHE